MIETANITIDMTSNAGPEITIRVALPYGIDLMRVMGVTLNLVDVIPVRRFEIVGDGAGKGAALVDALRDAVTRQKFPGKDVGIFEKRFVGGVRV